MEGVMGAVHAVRVVVSGEATGRVNGEERLGVWAWVIRFTDGGARGGKAVD